MVSRRLWEIIGVACGFILIDYGFNLIAVGLRGAQEFTSQFLGLNLILGGSAILFGALYYLLKPSVVQPRGAAQVAQGVSDIGVEIVVTEDRVAGPKIGFYRTIEYIGYFFTFLGLISAADLVLQVFIPAIYNEIRFWLEILLVVFGVLSYAIFVSIGRLGRQEEQIFRGSAMSVPPTSIPTAVPAPEVAAVGGQSQTPQEIPDTITLHLAEFTRVETGEYERRLTDTVYDMLKIEPVGVMVWREDRKGMRSVYLAGPYELKWKLLEDIAKRGEEFKVGALLVPPETLKELVDSRGGLR